MNLNYYIFSYRLLWKKIEKLLYAGSEGIILLSSVASLFLIVYLFGFEDVNLKTNIINSTRNYLLVSFFIGSTIRFALRFKDIVLERMIYIDIVIYLLLAAVMAAQITFKQEFADNLPYLSFFSSRTLAYVLLLSLSIINLSRQVFSILQANISPTLLFVLSFIMVIVIGTGLLMLPNATNVPIRFIDALFTATSAVCVTGLSTVDMIQTFSSEGMFVILILIQVGGIGVMTFTSFFALSFMGSSSFNSQMILKDMFNEDRVNGLFMMIVNILLVTFIVEIAGAYFIYQSIAGTFPEGVKEEVYFAIFHSISAFCNAGFSTLEGGLSNPIVSLNGSLHLIMALVIIIGGLGFPIVFNYMKLLKHYVVNGFKMLFLGQKGFIHTARIININTYIVMVVTISLIAGGTVLYFITEYNNTLKDLPLGMKIIESFFGAVTPRTAGFGIYSVSELATPTFVMTMILMGIGGAPMSTAGGIKVTTIKVAMQSAWDTILNKPKVIIRNREIPDSTIRKAYATIIMFATWVMLASYLLTLTDGKAHIFTYMFEVFSALSTVGWTMDYTPLLSPIGKVIIMLTMFVGRIGVITFFMSFIRQRKPKRFSYPQENILM
jgi:Trk-type K+ transport system membrane component